MLSLNWKKKVQLSKSFLAISKTTEGLRNKLVKWKEALQRKDLKVNLGITKMKVSGGITNDGLSKSKVDPCGVSNRRAKAN